MAIRRPDRSKTKQLAASWEKVLKRHGLDRQPTRRKVFKPLTKPLYHVGLSGSSRQEVLDRLRQKNPEPSTPVLDYDPDMQAREAAARKVRHTIMPLHKGPYVVVTDPELIPQMGKKTFDG